LGNKKWRKRVLDIIERLRAALEPDSVVIGGGNAKHLRRLPPSVRLGNNTHAYVGGLRLWADTRPRRGAASSEPSRRSARPHRRMVRTTRDDARATGSAG
jgi:polyphosphate glucokinase